MGKLTNQALVTLTPVLYDALLLMEKNRQFTKLYEQSPAFKSIQYD